MCNILDGVLFMERRPPPRRVGAHNRGSELVESAFWNDSFNRNLSLEHCEVELRLGRCRERHFESEVSARAFEAICSAFQSYGEWDARSESRATVAYFERTDATLRMVVEEGGKVEWTSKQRVMTADFDMPDAPYDARLAVSLELPVRDQPRLADSTRRCARVRQSYAHGAWRYDLTRVETAGSSPTYHVEVELRDPHGEQTRCNNSQQLVAQLQARLDDVLTLVEPGASSAGARLRRRRWY